MHRLARGIESVAQASSLVTNVHLTRRHPVSLVQFVTRRCNARCSFCFIDFDHPEPKRLELSLEEIEAMTERLLKANTIDDVLGKKRQRKTARKAATSTPRRR